MNRIYLLGRFSCRMFFYKTILQVRGLLKSTCRRRFAYMAGFAWARETTGVWRETLHTCSHPLPPPTRAHHAPPELPPDWLARFIVGHLLVTLLITQSALFVSRLRGFCGGAENEIGSVDVKSEFMYYVDPWMAC